MGMPLLNHNRSYKQISTVGEIDCPNPNRFNSPLTQNQFLILIVDKNVPDATQKKWVDIENSLRLHTCQSPAAAAEAV